MSKAPGIHPGSCAAILAAALVLALFIPVPAQARGGGGGHGGGAVGFHGGGAAGFQGGHVGITPGASTGAFRGGFAVAPGNRFRGMPNARLRSEHRSMAFRAGRGFVLSGPGAPPLRGRAVPPLNGVAVPPLQGGTGLRGPEIWRRGQDGTWRHSLGGRPAGPGIGVIGFGLVMPAYGAPPVFYPYGTVAYGATCNAAPYLCPIDPAAPVGTSCACPVEDGRLAPGWVE